MPYAHLFSSATGTMSLPVCNKHHQLNPETCNSARDRLEYRVHGWKFLREKRQSACLVLSINKQALPKMRGLMAGGGRNKT